MRQISSTQAKQAFGELLETASREPVAIEKHQKIKVIVASPQFFASADRMQVQMAERRAARARHALVEKDRLIRHQKIAIDLLTLPPKGRKELIQRAHAVVARWKSERLCSLDYIEKWQSLLSLSTDELARTMITDMDGWGNALRQNSPWQGAL